MKKFKAYTLTFFLLIFLCCCDKGCIDADDDGSVQKGIPKAIYPINPNIVSTQSTSSVEFSSSNIGALSSQYMVKSGSTNEQASSGIWQSFEYIDRISNTKSDIMAYSGLPININVTGEVLLNGAQDIVTLPAEVEQLDIGYFIPTVTSNISLSAGSEVNISVITPATSTQNSDSIVPNVNGVSLNNGLGVFAMIRKYDSGNLSKYGKHNSWACTNGLGGTNNGKNTTADLMSGCTTAPDDHIGYGIDTATGSPVDIDETRCNPSSFPNECSGFAYDPEASGYNAQNEQDSSQIALINFETNGWSGLLPMEKRLRYLFHSQKMSYHTAFKIAFFNDHNFFANDAQFSDKDRFTDYNGTCYNGCHSRSRRLTGADVPIHDSQDHSIRFYNPWVYNSDFSICTHDMGILGWATSNDYKIADLPSNGALSKWYFERGSCSAIDSKYSISKTNALYGGLVYYHIADTNLWWGNHKTDNDYVTECNFCNNPNPNKIEPFMCNNLNCSIVEGGGSRNITPMACKVNTFSTVYPLQYIKMATLVSDPSHINAPKFERGRCGGNNYKFEDEVSVMNCSYRVTTNGSSIGINQTRANEWVVASPVLTNGSRVDIDVSGGYTQRFGYKGVRDLVVSPLMFVTLGIKGCCDNLAGSDDGYRQNNLDIYRDFGLKNCRSSTVFAVKQIPFVSCFSGYRSGCSTLRNPSSDETDAINGCGGSITYTDEGGSSQTVNVGSCNKIVNGVIIPQRYNNFALPRVNDLVDSKLSFVSAENIRMDHCGICVNQGLKYQPNSPHQIVSKSDIIPVGTAGIIGSVECQLSNDYQWLTSFIDADTGGLVSYSFRKNTVSSFCSDDHKTQRLSPDGKLVSLTSLDSENIYPSSDIIYGEVGSFVNGVDLKTSANMTYTIPDNMDSSSISFGIAGNGSDVRKMFTAADRSANSITGGYKSFQILIQSGRVAKNGKYLFFYVQPFKKDNNGNYTTVLDQNKHPNILFSGKSYDQIYEYAMKESNVQILYDFIQEDLASGGTMSSDGTIDGAAQIIPSMSGKLWVAVLDLSNEVDYTYDTTNGKDRDGKAIVYKKNVVTKDPGISVDYTNVVSWNTGKYVVTVRAKRPIAQTSVLGSTIVKSIADFIKSLFFGTIIQGACRTVVVSVPVSNTTVYDDSSKNDAKKTPFVPQYCKENNQMLTLEALPTSISDAAGFPITTYYNCSINEDDNKYYCRIAYKNVSQASRFVNDLPVNMILQRYGDCVFGTVSTGNTKVCNVYTFNQSAKDINICLRSDVSNTSCWIKTSRSDTILQPYEYIQNNDMVPGNIMPPCNTGNPYKSYSNCSIINGVQTCDINRDCTPNGSITQSKVQVPLFVYRGKDLAITGISDDSINSISSCTPISRQIMDKAYCIQDTNDPGYFKCDFTNLETAQCASCIRPTISAKELRSYSAANIPYSCTGTNDNLFYCDSEAYQACKSYSTNGAQLQSDIKFLNSASDIVTICNLSSISPSPNVRVSKSLLDTDNSDISVCTVNRNCVYSSYTPPITSDSESSSVSNNNSSTSSSNFNTAKICDTTYEWETGLIYQIATLFTKSFSIIAIFYIAIIFYIMLRGLGIFLGTENVSMKDLQGYTWKIALVMMFFSPMGWNYYQYFIIELYVNFTEGLNTVIAGIVMPQSTQNGTNLFGPVDQVLDETFLNRTAWIKASAMLFSTWYGWILFICFVASLFIYIITAFKAIAMYLSTIIMSSIFFSIGIVFFALSLFKETEKFFDAWKSQIIGMIASQAYLFAAIAVFSSLYLGAVEGLLYYKVCFKSIISIPVINVTILGWWKIASNALPEAIVYQIGNTNAMLSSYDTNMPTPSKVIMLLLIVGMMEKFIQTPLVGGKGGMDIADAVSPLLDKVSGAVRGAAVTGIMAPVAVAEGVVSKLPGGDALVNRLGISQQGAKLLSGQDISVDEISRPSDSSGLISGKTANTLGRIFSSKDNKGSSRTRNTGNNVYGKNYNLSGNNSFGNNNGNNYNPSRTGSNDNYSHDIDGGRNNNGSNQNIRSNGLMDVIRELGSNAASDVENNRSSQNNRSNELMDTIRGLGSGSGTSSAGGTGSGSGSTSRSGTSANSGSTSGSESSGSD